jgi:peptidoglycan lytic transglycosylase
MKTGRNRLWRQDHLWVAPILIAATIALGTVPAQAGTGGASVIASGGGQAESGIAFTPMRWAGATWYGPGLYGSHTACGQVLRPGTIGVAHRDLPCGTAVKFVYRGHQIVTAVIDRGPFSRGNSWDLTNGARRLLGFDGSGPIRYAVSLQYARHAPLSGHTGR